VSAPGLENRSPLRGQGLCSLGESATLAGVGGALDAFTYLGHGHVFANAMTGNVVSPGSECGSRRLAALAVPLVADPQFLPRSVHGESHQSEARLQSDRNPDLAALNLEITIFAILGCLPASAPNLLITISVAFAASLQTATFRTVEGQSYNSTFTTGNLLTLSEDAFVWLVRKRPAALRRPAQVFAIVCGAFLLGVLAGGLMTPHLYNKTLWPICCVLLVLRRRLARNYFPAAA